jgi:multiple sugar transport system substrate-binding protein
MDWDIAPLPAGPAKRATIVAGEYLAVFKQSKNPEAAWTFIKWITEPDVQAFWSMKSGYLPMRKSVLDEPEYQRYLEGNSAHRAFVEQMSVAQVQRPIVYFPLEIERNLAVAIEKATVSGDDPRAVLAEAVAASNALLQSGNPE